MRVYHRSYDRGRVLQGGYVIWGYHGGLLYALLLGLLYFKGYVRVHCKCVYGIQYGATKRDTHTLSLYMKGLQKATIWGYQMGYNTRGYQSRVL